MVREIEEELENSKSITEYSISSGPWKRDLSLGSCEDSMKQAKVKLDDIGQDALQYEIHLIAQKKLLKFHLETVKNHQKKCDMYDPLNYSTK